MRRIATETQAHEEAVCIRSRALPCCIGLLGTSAKHRARAYALRGKLMRTRLVLIEGLPGAGKTTLAERLCASACTRGIPSRWYLEEAVDHPVHPRSLNALNAQADHAAHYLKAWQGFVDRAKVDNTLHILEGSAFQSTTRFLMAHERTGIAAYFRHFGRIVAALRPVFIYLRPEDAACHSRATATHRGTDWMRKVAAHTQQTPYAQRHGMHGEHGMHRFWSDYALLCDALVGELAMPVIRIEPRPGQEDRVLAEATASIHSIHLIQGTQ